jgi:hypothetical protein
MVDSAENIDACADWVSGRSAAVDELGRGIVCEGVRGSGWGAGLI